MALAYREADVAHPLDGAGFVVPAREGFDLRACTFAHRKYAGRAPAGMALLRAFHGERALARTDDELVGVTARELAALLGVRGEPVLSHVTRWPGSMPQYEVGHLERVRAIEERLAAHSGLFLAGNACRGVGIPDCVRSGEAAAEAVLFD